MRQGILTTAKSKHLKTLQETLSDFQELDPILKKIDIALGDRGRIAERLAELKKPKTNGVYAICTSGNLAKIKRDLLKFKATNKLDRTPNINIDHNPKYGCLYVGMTTKTTLHNRLMGHLDVISEGTWALKLGHWCKEKSVTVYYLSIDNKDVCKEYEKALWHYLKPAIGKL
jgi:hypothetical protein